VQISNGGAAFLAGKGIKNEKQKAAVLGSIAGAQGSILRNVISARNVFQQIVILVEPIKFHAKITDKYFSNNNGHNFWL
jgi:hypothetical protein